MYSSIITLYKYNDAGVAQLVEQLICNHQVRGSNPCAGTIQRRYMGRVFAHSVLETNPDVSKFELVIIASKMHRMGLRPTLAECLRALETNEIDPKDIIEEIVSPTKPKEEEKELEIRGSQNIVDKK